MKEQLYDIEQTKCKCDNCHKTLMVDSLDYEVVNSTMKALGWQNRLANGEWKVYCKECKKVKRG